MTIPSLSSQYGQLDLSALLAELARKNQTLAEERLATVEVEAKICAREAQAQQSAGFLDELSADAVKEAGQDFQATFGDAQSTADGLAQLDSLITSAFDPESLLAGLTAGDGRAVVANLDRFYSDTAPAGLLERLAGPTLKNALGLTACQRNVVAATLTTAAQVAVGALGNQLRAVRAVQSGFAFLTAAGKELGPALLDLPVQSLLALLGSQNLILQKVASVARQIARLLRELTAADYPPDHLTLVRREQLRLLAADRKLAAAEARLFAGADLSRPLWNGARRDIEDAAKALCGFDFVLFGGLSFRPFKLIGLTLYLETLLRVLARQQQVRDRLQGALAGFERAFFGQLRFDNLFLPIIGQVRCRLQLVIEDMEATIGRNQFLRYLIKEKQWCLELKALAAFMKWADRIDLHDQLERFSGTDLLRRAARAVWDATSEQHARLDRQNVWLVVRAGEALLARLERAAVVPVAAGPLADEAEALAAAADAARQDGGLLGGVLGAFSGRVAETAAEVVLIVGQLLEFADERQLPEFSQALREGRVADAFGVDGFTSTLEGQLDVLALRTIAVVRANGGSATAESELQTVATLYRDEARSIGLRDTLRNEAPARHLAVQLEVEGPRYRDPERRIARAAEASGSAATAADASFLAAPAAVQERLRTAV